MIRYEMMVNKTKCIREYQLTKKELKVNFKETKFDEAADWNQGRLRTMHNRSEKNGYTVISENTTECCYWE